MILSKYIIYKFASALTITLTAFFSLFYIGSLIDNLILDLNFTKISLITFFDSISIIVIIPEIIFFFSVLLFCLIIRSSNELLIIRHYLNKRKLSIVFLIFVSFCYAISINKTLILDNIDMVKYNISNESNDKIIKNKILVDTKEKNKIFYELININLKDQVINNLKIHNFENNNHIQTLVSNDVRYDKEKIFLETFTIITKDNIYKSSVKKIYNINHLESYLLSNDSVRYVKNSFSDNFIKNNIFKSLNFILLLFIISLLFIQRSLIKNNYIFTIYLLAGLLLIIYSFILNFIDVKYFEIFFNLSGTLFFSYTLYFVYNND